MGELQEHYGNELNLD